MGCDRHGQTNNVFCKYCDAEQLDAHQEGGIFAQLSPEQQERAKAVRGPIRSGLSDLPTVNTKG
jgi:hypothetical protein